MAYKWYDNGSIVPITWKELIAIEQVYTYPGTGSILQMSEFGEIAGTEIRGVSSMLDIKIWRDDNIISGDVLAKEFDIHIEIDTIGSREEYIK